MPENYLIPLSEIQFEYSRSSGPGGQNINKTASRAQLRWLVGVSLALTEEEKNRVRDKLRNRLTNNDEIILVAEGERSQLQNKERVFARFQKLIAEALVVPKPRQPTKPTRTAKEKRLKEKKKRSTLKKMRRDEVQLASLSGE